MNALSPAGALLAETALSSAVADPHSVACARFVDLCAQRNAIGYAAESNEAVQQQEGAHDAIYDQQHAVLDDIEAHQATTLDEHQARARALAAYAPDLEMKDGVAADRLVRLLVRDMLRPAASSPLMLACAEYIRISQSFDAAYDALPDGQDMPDDHPAWNLLATRASLMATIVSAQATTAEEFLARLRCQAMHLLPHCIALRDDPDGYKDERIQKANLRDAVALNCKLPMPPDRDVEYVALCNRHIANLAAVNAPGAGDELEDGRQGPLARAYDATEAAIRQQRPTTPAGLVALARMMKVEATRPAGTEHPQDIPDDMVGALMNAVLAVLGGESGR